MNPGVEALQVLRGVPFTVAVTLVAELGDLTRFDHPSELMNYLGRTPSESSSGERRRQGAITKSGNTHARRVQQPKVLQDISWKAQVRLCKRYRQLIARGKHANQVVVAMARELLGFIWAIAKQVSLKP